MPDYTAERVIVEGQLFLEIQLIGQPIYDFDFRTFFHCRQPWGTPAQQPLVARVGAFHDYPTWYADRIQEGLRPIHSPADYLRCTQLSEWYPLIQEFTPRSHVYPVRPTIDQVQSDFDWPIFVKGVRQTSRHQRRLSVISSSSDFIQAMDQYERDSILSWQPLVVREFVRLRPIEDAIPERIPSSFEFRTFWWQGICVGAGRYWWQGKPYDWSPREREDALRLGEVVASRLQVPFLVIDLAMTMEGRWIVIECNDGQESGYAGVSPLAMWSAILQQQN